MRKCVRALLVLSLTIHWAGLAWAAPKDDAWAGYRFLLGEWIGEGNGSPGKGSGQCSFTLDLQDKVIVRKNHADYPASGGRPAFAHDDLMVIHHGQDGKQAKARYFDNEGHVIQYTITPSEDGRKLTFVSDAASNAPRFRMTYTRSEADTMHLKFEIAPPGKPDDFKTYIEAGLHRK
jgi:hypothetical protein